MMLCSDVNNRQTILARSIIAYFGHYFAHHYIAEIAYFFDRHAESVSRMMHRELRKSHQHPATKMLMTVIEKDLKEFCSQLIDLKKTK